MKSLFTNTRVELKGRIVHLLPLEKSHYVKLYEIAEGENIWQWFPYLIKELSHMRDQIEFAVDKRDSGLALPFVIVKVNTGEIVGSTRFFEPSVEHRRVEIGHTWIGPKWQRTGVNIESKYLMLKYAFETLDCIRVELKTDRRNIPSQESMTALGLVREGTLRSHMITQNGFIRDTVYFSCIRPEWPQLEASLRLKIEVLARELK